MAIDLWIYGKFLGPSNLMEDILGKAKIRGASQYKKRYFAATRNDQNMNLKQNEKQKMLGCMYV